MRVLFDYIVVKIAVFLGFGLLLRCESGKEFFVAKFRPDGLCLIEVEGEVAVGEDVMGWSELRSSFPQCRKVLAQLENYAKWRFRE